MTLVCHFVQSLGRMSTMLEAIGVHKISLNWEEKKFDCYLVYNGDGGVMEIMILTKMEMMIV